MNDQGICRTEVNCNFLSKKTKGICKLAAIKLEKAEHNLNLEHTWSRLTKIISRTPKINSTLLLLSFYAEKAFSLEKIPEK